jgi:alpha-1,6-mannosyltransferase
VHDAGLCGGAGDLRADRMSRACRMEQLRDRIKERRWLVALVLIGAALLALVMPMLQFVDAKQYEGFVGAALAQSLLYAIAVWLIVRRRWDARVLWIVLAVAALARAMVLLSPATLSDDIYRYVWDGRVQAAGINPYRYVPADPALASLRDAVVYPHINRADYAPTIYPPVAQMIFFIVTRIGETGTAMKLAMLGFEAVTIGAILALLRRDGLPPERAVIYAWHPLPIWEFTGAGHVDAAAVALLCLALLAATRERPVLTGAALALSALVKPFALVVAPALWKKWDFRMPAAFAGVLIACYAPYLGVGSRVFGFLGGYGDEEGYLEGGGFFLTTLLRHLGVPVPAGVSAAIAALILAAVALFLALRERPEPADPWPPLLLATVFLVLLSPHFPWYFAWVLPLLCRRLYLPLLYLTLVCFVLYLREVKGWPDLGGGDTVQISANYKAGLWLYGGFAILALADGLMRIPRFTARRPA